MKIESRRLRCAWRESKKGEATWGKNEEEEKKHNQETGRIHVKQMENGGSEGNDNRRGAPGDGS